MPTATRERLEEGRGVVEARHPEYSEFVTTWRWLLDSLEGGERYREADYGQDTYTVQWTDEDPETGRQYGRSQHHQIPRRNLVRHPQEYPQAPYPLGGTAGLGIGTAGLEGPASSGDEYEFRRALTPVPTFVEEAIEAHLSRLYGREVKREAPAGPAYDGLRAWWADVDGSGTTIDDWMRESIAPMFLVLGQVDLLFDHPAAPDGERVETRADVERLGLARCVASYILPENVVNWDLGPDKAYTRAVVREIDDEGDECYREWTADGWRLFAAGGSEFAPDRGELIGRADHPFGVVPILRAFDRRKPRCDHVGQSRYDGIAQLQRAYYNADSELTLANSLAAHPILSGPEDFCQGNSLPIGPGFLLPKKRSASRDTYEGWEYVSAPSDTAEKIAAKLETIRDQADRAACLTKPAGVRGTGGSTVSQSGVSKMLDQATGNDLLKKLARSLERLERRAVAMVLAVTSDGPPDPKLAAAVELVYPTEFDLYTPADFGALVGEFLATVGEANADLPELSGHLFGRWTRLALPGLDDRAYATLDDEFVAYLGTKAERAAEMAEMTAAVPKVPVPDGSIEPDEEVGGPDESE